MRRERQGSTIYSPPSILFGPISCFLFTPFSAVVQKLLSVVAAPTTAFIAATIPVVVIVAVTIAPFTEVNAVYAAKSVRINHKSESLCQLFNE